MSIFAQATFTGANGTALSSYTPEVGTIAKHPQFNNAAPVITGNRLRCNSQNLASPWFFNVTPPDANYQVRANWRAVSNSGVISVQTRVDPTTYTLYEAQWNAGSFTLYRWVNNAFTSLATASFAISNGDDVSVALQAVTVGNTVFVYLTVNGTALIAYADSNASRITATGKPGFNWFQLVAAGDSAGIHLDSIEAGFVGDSFAMDNANVYLSELNWKLNGSTYAQSNTPGAYFKTKFTGTSLVLDVDPSSMVSVSLTAAQYPKVIAVVDGVRQSFVQMQSTSTRLTLASGLDDEEHEVTVYFAGIYWNSKDRWTTPSMVLRVNGIVLDSGDTLSAPTIRDRKLLMYCDSNGEGWEAIATGVTVANMDASRAFPILLADLMDAEVSVVAFAGQGYTAAVATANVPDLVDAWDFYWDSNSRLSSSEFVSQPGMVLVFHGQNDDEVDITEDVEGLIAAWRTAAPGAPIAVCVPPIGTHQDEIADAVTAAADANAKAVDIDEALIGNPSYTNNVHLSLAGHTYYAAQVYAELQARFPAFFGLSTGSPGISRGFGRQLIHGASI